MPARTAGIGALPTIAARNRHCPKCQGAAARNWLSEREADLLPVGYFHVVFTLPTKVADIAVQNKAIVYDLLFRAASQTMITIAADPKHLGAHLGITFRYKDYRRDGPERQRVMTLAPHEFIRRFLLHVPPRGFHRIRHYGLLASSARKASIARARELLAVPPPPEPVELPEPFDRLPPCPCCGGRMTIIETFGRWKQPRAPPHTPASTGSTPS